MNTRITARHFDLDPDLKAYVEEKVTHLSHYFDRVDEANVVLEAEGHRRRAVVTVHASRVVLSSEQEADDVRTAFDKAIDKVERRVRRHKDKLRNRKSVQPTAEVAEKAGGVAPDQVGIVREELLSSPMTAEEALKELDSLNIRFLAFNNAETGRINVIYRRDDGNYGLVEPDELG